MKYIRYNILSVLFVLLLSQTSFSQQLKSNLIKTGSVGEIKIGDVVEKVYSLVGKENSKLIDLYLEGDFSPAVHVKSNNKGYVNFELDCNTVFRITITDIDYKTLEGISVGSKVADIQSKYLDYSLDLENGKYFIFLNKLNIALTLNTSQLLEAKFNFRDKYDIESLPKEVEVVSIIVI